ncbi:MAG TPA: transketolase [Bacteroidetes bacterium]|nr:transketolase [Bacteroidota bacterium]
MSTLEQRCVNTIRTLSMDAVQKANSGHPGMPMGMADVAFVLWNDFLKHNPVNPHWVNRDRFVLSAGHGSMLLYSLLHLTGYDLTMDDLKNFRQWGSKTPGHPEFGHTAGVETTTGPLGQGFATGVGMAIAERHLSAKINTPDKQLIDHTIYAIVSDGDLMEGISHEAASLAGHLKLGNLIYLYDDNKISIDGSTDLAFTEDVCKRFNAYGWHTIKIDGHNRDEIRKAIAEAQKITDKPTLIACRTHIGFGSPSKQGTAASHGSPLGDEEIRKTKTFYGVNPDLQFHIDDEVLDHFRQAQKRGQELEQSWNQQLEGLKNTNSENYALFQACLDRSLPTDFDAILPKFDENEKGIATRKASGLVLDAVATKIPGIMGGSADLGGSNLTEFKGNTVFSSENHTGNYMHYGVREHTMGAIMNGMALHGTIRPFGGTFLVFADYCKPAIRLAALMNQPVIYVFTHDSIGLGEDGPTHQPIEHLASLRSIPNVVVLRPADANETAIAWKVALNRMDGPTLLVLTRQNLPEISREEYNRREEVSKGAYIFKEAPNGAPESIIMATGSEVSIAHEAWKELTKMGKQVRLVSMPSWELFNSQPQSYRDKILPPAIKQRVSIEAASTFGWHRYIGSDGVAIGLDHFGASAPYETLYKEFGLTAQRIVEELS